MQAKEFKVKWGMVIDLDKCTGCGACAVACKAENNLPPEVDASNKLRSTDWMNIYELSNEKPFPEHEVAYLPRPCMQCGKPSCSTVCPVVATLKDEEGGIVSQVYPRCIGCRYCMAACPYHARYFNWFDPIWPEGMEKTLTPYVSARPRGVVEKCTFCHHRFTAAKEQARMNGEDPTELPENAYIPACAEICPTGAMKFGNLNNPEHEASKLAASKYAFRLLEKLGTDPQVYYYSKREWVRKLGDNYLKNAKGANMSDRAYWPEGVERCSVGRFLAWLGVISIFLAWGGYGAFKVLGTGIGVTGLDNYFGFGLWITFDLAVIALGAGAFFSGFLRYIIRIDELKNIINLAVIIGFLCYSGAMLVLVLDVGQPVRAWFGYWHPNVHSMLTEVIFCITCYLTVLIIEFVPLILENRKINENRFCHHLAHNFHVYMPLFAGIGTFLSFFHQGSLGGMYGVLFGRPFVFREGFFIWPWTFFLFISSAIASGPGFTMLCATLMEVLTGRKLVSYETKKLMGKISGLLLCFYMFFKIIDTYAWAKGILPGMGLTFDQMYNSEYGYGTIWLWGELVIGGLIPAVMLIIPAVRNTPALLYTAAILAAVGVTINRFVFTVQALAIPVMPFDRWTTYIPNWAEWSTSLMIVAYGFFVMSLSYRYLPIFPQEVKLNK